MPSSFKDGLLSFHSILQLEPTDACELRQHLSCVLAPRIVVLRAVRGPADGDAAKKALPQAYSQLQSTAQRGLRSLAVSTDSGIY